VLTYFKPKNFTYYMKSIKGLLLILSMTILAFSGVESDSNSQIIKDDIFTAIRSIDYTSINVLLSDATDVDTVDQNGNTPLMVAAHVGNPRIMNIILSHNPTINKQNNEGMTALMIAAEAGQFHAVQKLVAHGADQSILNTNGNTAVTLASKFGHNQIVTFFQEKRIIRSYTK